MYTLGIDIGSTTVKVAVLDKAGKILFSDYKRHFVNIKETLKISYKKQRMPSARTRSIHV